MKHIFCEADPHGSVNLDRKSYYQPNKTPSPAFEAYFQHFLYLLLMKVIYRVGREIYATPSERKSLPKHLRSEGVA